MGDILGTTIIRYITLGGYAITKVNNQVTSCLEPVLESDPIKSLFNKRGIKLTYHHVKFIF